MIENIPNTIYHYCDLNAFLAILKYKKIWLSNSYLMNDSFENKWINQHIEEVRKEFHEYNELIERIVKSYYSSSEVPYISCFSGEGDILSQWRAYANDGKGVAIGFNTNFFNHVSILDNSSPAGNPIILSPVIYDNDAQRQYVREIFQIAIQKFKIGEKERAHQIGHTALKRMSMISKNPAFREEKEYRLIYMPYYLNLITEIEELKNNKDLTNLEVQFRAKDDQIISYFELDISRGKTNEPISTIISGPKNKMSNYEMQIILKAYGLKVLNLPKSSASYR